MQELVHSDQEQNGSVIRHRRKAEGGFSLVEVIFALVILLVALLGVFFTFTYAINYNAGNNSRSQALAVLQQKVENIRSAKFTPQTRDAILDGGTRLPERIILPNGYVYIIDVSVDDDPFTDGLQTDTATTIKEISVTVTLDRPTPGWQTAVPAIIILQRVRSN
jgi:type II secretory pathway pseudopilin PulG